jgi:hypothetical protein
MKASAETLKGMMLGGNDLKGYYDFMSELLDVVVDVVEAIGGLPTILAAVSAALLKIYQP